MEASPVESGAQAPSLDEDPALGLSRRQKLEILGAVLLGLFLVALDQTIVGTALPRIVTDLGGNDLYTWVVTIYLLTSTITVPFYGNIPIGIVSLAVIWKLLPTIKRSGASRNLDYLGAMIFTIAIGFLLVGLTNKQSGDWSDFVVGGFIAIGLALSAVFVLAETRAKEPIVPLDLWRNRTYVSSVLSTFFVSFGFFGAIIFLPRWFQVVREETATASGYLIFPMLIGMIGSSIMAGILVSRTGKYKAIVTAGLATMAVGITLMTQLRADTEYPVLFLWMFVTGLGIGPTLSVFTIIVQNAVPFAKLGVATSNLTFFRQIGGSVGLAIAGTLFG